jgi:hypothetical protein
MTLILMALACNATSRPTPTPAATFTPRPTVPTSTPQPTLTPTPSPPEISAGITSGVSAVEGVSTVRVADVLPFDDGYIVYLEVDTQRGYNSLATASLVRVASDAITGTAHVEFSVVLWDRVTRATNYTWDEENNQWLTTRLTANPG